MNKFLVMILLAAALMTGAFGITACGDDSDDDTDTSSDTDKDGGDEDGGVQDAGK